jgi:hypothetical protein
MLIDGEVGHKFEPKVAQDSPYRWETASISVHRALEFPEILPASVLGLSDELGNQL